MTRSLLYPPAWLLALTLEAGLVGCGSTQAPQPSSPTYNQPVINNVVQPPRIVAGHSGYTFTILATKGNPDDILSASVSIPPGQGSATGNGLVFTFTPPASESAAETIKLTFTISNQHDQSVTVVVPVVVNPNASPAFVYAATVTKTFSKDKSATEVIDMAAKDSDGDAVTYVQVFSWPSWASLDPKSGKVTIDVRGVPYSDLSTPVELTLEARDACGGTAQGIITVTITG